MKKIGFLSFGHWTPSPDSEVRSASDALLQSIDLAVAAEELGADGAFFRVHHFARQLGSPFPLLAAVGRMQLDISRGSPEQVIDGFRHFGYQPAEGDKDGADIARQHTEVFLDLLKGEGFARPNPRPMFPNPPGLLRLEPYSPGLLERIWWGSSSNSTSVWAAEMGMNLQSSTLKEDESFEPLHVQQRRQIEAYREAWREAGHTRQPRVSVSR